MRQYLDIKERHPDGLVLFRLGDFYEMFFEDAVIGARLLDLTLTTRDKGKDDAVPGYIAKLTELGHKIVLAEQVEDPKLAKGLVKREVVRIVTPGIVLDDDVLEPKLPRYLAALVPGPVPVPPGVRPPAPARARGSRTARSGEGAARSAAVSSAGAAGAG